MPTGNWHGDGSEGWRRLWAATLAQALLDAQGPAWKDDPDDPTGSPEEARAWLRSEMAERIACELDCERSLERWLHESMHGMRAPSPRRGGRGNPGARRYAPDCA